MPEWGEEELIRRCRRGDPDAWNALLKQHHQVLFSVAYRITLNADEAEDALQDAWVRIAKGLNSFDHRSSFRTWATRIVVRQALTNRKSLRPTVSYEENEMLGNIRAPEPDRVEEMDLKNALSVLPVEERTAVVLHYAEGYTFQEVANVLEIPLRTAADYAYRGLRRLRMKMIDPLPHAKETR